MSNLILPVALKGGVAQTKDSFHRDGRSFLKRLQKVLGVTGKVKSNRAGVAVYGDVRLTVGDGATNHLEVVFLSDEFPEQPAKIKVLYRKLFKDHLGFERTGPNQWMTLASVEADPEGFLDKLSVEMSADGS